MVCSVHMLISLPGLAVTRSEATRRLCAVLRCQMPTPLFQAQEILPLESGTLELAFAEMFLWAIKLVSDAWRSRETLLYPGATTQQPKCGASPKADACTHCRAITAKFMPSHSMVQESPQAVWTPASGSGMPAQGKFDKIPQTNIRWLTNFTVSARQSCRVTLRSLVNCKCAEIPS